MKSSSSCARFNPARALFGLLVWLLGNSALRRLYAVLRTLQIGNGVLSRLRRRAFPARSFRRPPGANGRPDVL